MDLRSVNPFRTVLCALVAGLLLVGCSERRTDVSWTQSSHATGTVTAIDREAMTLDLRVLLRTHKLRMTRPSARYDRLKVGDRLRLYFHEAIVLAITEANGPPAETVVRYRLGEAENEDSQVALVRALTFTAVFVAFDNRSSIVTFQLPDGQYRDVLVPRQLRSFIEGRVSGDLLNVSVEQALSVALEPRVVVSQ